MRIALFIVFFSCSTSYAQSIIDFEGLTSRIEQNNDSLYVINFWATWCKPCIAELPFFESVSQSYSEKPVKIILVSLDFKSDLNRLSDFISRKQIRNEVVLLDAGNPNIWINLLDPEWSGAIPATLFYKNSKKLEFHEGDYSLETLTQSINKYIR